MIIWNAPARPSWSWHGDSILIWFEALLRRTPEEFWQVMGGVLMLLLIASTVAALLKRRKPGATVDNLVARINAWWAMVAVLGACFLLGPVATLVLFAIASFLALRNSYTDANPARRPSGAVCASTSRSRCSTS